MKKALLITTVMTIVMVFGISVSTVNAQTKKIGMTKARAIALKQAPGKVESGEFEKENGKYIYSFDIRNKKGTISEVQVEAYTGKIVSVKEEGKKAEAAEKRSEAKEKRAKNKTKTKSNKH